jgi:hypothetical protein
MNSRTTRECIVETNSTVIEQARNWPLRPHSIIRPGAQSVEGGTQLFAAPAVQAAGPLSASGDHPFLQFSA